MKAEWFLWVILLGLLWWLVYMIAIDEPLKIENKCWWNGNIYYSCEDIDFISEID